MNLATTTKTRTTARTEIASGTVYGEWHDTMGRGCTGIVRERVVYHVEVFEADYGYGLRMYASGRNQIELANGSIGPNFGGWVDGDQARVQEWLSRLA